MHDLASAQAEGPRDMKSFRVVWKENNVMALLPKVHNIDSLQ